MGDFEQIGGFLVGAAEEIAQFDGANLAFVERFEFRQGLVEGHHLAAGRIHPGDVGMQGDADGLGAGALQRVGAAGVIGEDAAHDHGGKSEEVPAVGELGAPLPGEPEIQFVD